MKKTYFLIFLLTLGLSACGGSGSVKPSESTKTSKSKDGGYYLDDGPEVNLPANIDSIPDAIPKDEPLQKYSNRPYKALGKTYYPIKSSKNYKARGIASWYGKRYHGRKTASGEVYDMYSMTAAHTVLPLPSYVKVTNVSNGRSVIVRVNDRGPFKHGREIDLSYAAAYKLRLIEQGSGEVEVEAITPSQFNKQPNNIQIAPSSSAGNASSIIKNNDDTVTSNQYYIQAGAFSNETNAANLLQKIKAINSNQSTKIVRVYNNGLHKLTIGPYGNRQDAEQFANQINQQLNTPTLINQK